MRINYFYDRRPITAAHFAAEAIRTFEAEREFQSWRESADTLEDFSWGYYRARKVEEEA
jgi:hypothetical protein